MGPRTPFQKGSLPPRLAHTAFLSLSELQYRWPDCKTFQKNKFASQQKPPLTKTSLALVNAIFSGAIASRPIFVSYKNHPEDLPRPLRPSTSQVPPHESQPSQRSDQDSKGFLRPPRTSQGPKTSQGLARPPKAAQDHCRSGPFLPPQRTPPRPPTLRWPERKDFQRKMMVFTTKTGVNQNQAGFG